MRLRIRQGRRTGFTLVELLVVIAIIAVLMSLLMAGVMAYMRKIPDLDTVNEIRQMTVSLEAFKTKYKVYPPSFINLSSVPANMDAADLAAGLAAGTSQAYVYAIWPRINLSLVDWTGQGNPANSITAVPLQGHQCLVFFLQGPTGNGFSTNPANPTALGGSRVGPFFNFDSGRLTSTTFGAYVDPYQKNTPYAYFSSGRSTNGYSANDCAALKVAPYFQAGTSPAQYYNASSFQIISAGRDGVFGPGTTPVAPGTPWSPVNAPNYVGTVGMDDYSNFYESQLGVGE
jgi:prepilin-type N-terminal cleavage/methylation domain-containing protein